jgi:hypothetical protein
MNGMYGDYPRTPSGCGCHLTSHPGVRKNAYPWLISMHASGVRMFPASGVIELKRISSDRSGMRLCYK